MAVPGDAVGATTNTSRVPSAPSESCPLATNSVPSYRDVPIHPSSLSPIIQSLLPGMSSA